MKETLSLGLTERTAVIRATVAIPLHNHGAYVGQLLESISAQWRPDLELLLIDDASTDHSFTEVHRFLKKHPEIPATLARMDKLTGMGLPQQILRLARGTIVIRADSDDIAVPGRLDAIIHCFDSDLNCRLVTSNAVLLSPEGLCCGLYTFKHPDTILSDPVAAAAVEFDPRWLGATIAYHRDIYDRFPPIDPELCPYGLDLILPLRAVLLGSHHYLMQPFVAYRQHSANTHRLSGALGGSLALQEHYQVMILMALMQKIRDIESFYKGQSEAIIDPIMDQCRANFLKKFDHWSRLRNRLGTKTLDDTAPTKAPATFLPAIAPIPTLCIEKPLHFAPGEFGAQCLSGVGGFHTPEDWGGMWTEAAAQFNVRIIHTSDEKLSLEFQIMISSLTPKQRVVIGLNQEIWHKTEWCGQQITNISCPIDIPDLASVISICILAPDALIPASIEQNQKDKRMIGIGLMSVTLRRDNELSI